MICENCKSDIFEIYEHSAIKGKVTACTKCGLINSVEPLAPIKLKGQFQKIEPNDELFKQVQTYIDRLQSDYADYTNYATQRLTEAEASTKRYVDYLNEKLNDNITYVNYLGTL